jgi:hypothetical protein
MVEMQIRLVQSHEKAVLVESALRSAAAVVPFRCCQLVVTNQSATRLRELLVRLRLRLLPFPLTTNPLSSTSLIKVQSSVACRQWCRSKTTCESS